MFFLFGQCFKPYEKRQCVYRIRFQDKHCQLCFKKIHTKMIARVRERNQNKKTDNEWKMSWEKRILNCLAILQVHPFLSYQD